jgi:hypothetical protein
MEFCSPKTLQMNESIIARLQAELSEIKDAGLFKGSLKVRKALSSRLAERKSSTSVPTITSDCHPIQRLSMQLKNTLTNGALA